MHYKRNEAYRYTFATPIDGKIKLVNEDEETIYSTSILDVSLNGIRIKQDAAYSLKTGDIVQVTYQLMKTDCQAVGTVVWGKRHYNYHIFGIKLNAEEAYQRHITGLLKEMVKSAVAHD
ncbi:PilZ domain-containing protein [Sediminibacillus halophilus]|uniref:PilZ domain-containing protein n=1 Tax=Sediminibacillus halophilus TaxID=482461 RepID=A0A1G9MZ98_9BACI|nr:PilZ domain-containing protein [Sediminibacillus halophilus]SDL79602.1 PilZ domain-containing protein [Sediminibacillus halophilus]